MFVRELKDLSPPLLRMLGSRPPPSLGGLNPVTGNLCQKMFPFDFPKQTHFKNETTLLIRRVHLMLIRALLFQAVITPEGKSVVKSQPSLLVVKKKPSIISCRAHPQVNNNQSQPEYRNGSHPCAKMKKVFRFSYFLQV